MRASGSWDRDEWQGRDMIHTHGMSSLQQQLGLRTLHDNAAAAEKRRREAVHKGDVKAVEEAIAQRTEAETKLIRALDILVCHSHPDGPTNADESFTMPVVHPCTRRIVDVFEMNQQDRDNHFRDLHSCCGLHYKCTSYCLRRHKKTKRLQCRMHFGTDRKPLAEETRIEYEEINGGDAIRPVVVYKRNHLKANNINKSQMYGWGFNTDFSACVNSQRVMDYAAKYSTKGAQRTKVIYANSEGKLGCYVRNDMCQTITQKFLHDTQAWIEASNTILKYANQETRGKSLLLKTVLQSQGQLDRGVQEWCHFITGKPACRLYRRGKDGAPKVPTQVKLNLYRSKIVRPAEPEDCPEKVVTLNSIVDAYANRMKLTNIFPSYDFGQMNLLQFAKKFTYVPSFERVYERKSDDIPILIAYPRGSTNTKYREGFVRYCACQLTKYCPWQREVSTLWGGDLELAPLVYKTFLETNELVDTEIKNADEIRLFRFFNPTEPVHGV